MTHSTVRGSDWEAPLSRRDYNARKTVQRDFIGFRLVYDDVKGNPIICGGHWFDAADDTRDAVRGTMYPDLRDGRLGFRLARENT